MCQSQWNEARHKWHTTKNEMNDIKLAVKYQRKNKIKNKIE